MEQVLKDIEGVFVYIDDIIIISKENHQQCLDRFIQVLERLEKSQLRIRLDKCSFFEENIKYMGRVITANGITMNKLSLNSVHH